MDWGTVGGTVGLIAGEVVGRRLPFVGRFVGAAVGQGVGALLGNRSPWEVALYESLYAGAGALALGAAGGRGAKHLENALARRVFAKEAQGNELNRLERGLLKDFATKDLASVQLSRSPLLYSPKARQVGGLVGGLGAVATVPAMSESFLGEWIGGYGHGLAEHFPASGGAGFLFWPSGMNDGLRPWYSRLAEVLAGIWELFGPEHRSTGIPPIVLPKDLLEVPKSSPAINLTPMTGVLAAQHRITAAELKAAMKDFAEVENALASAVVQCGVDITKGRDSILGLLTTLNKTVLRGGGDDGVFYKLVKDALARADQISRQAIRDQEVVSGKVCAATELLDPPPPAPPSPSTSTSKSPAPSSETPPSPTTTSR